MKWVAISERKPGEKDTHDGRVAIIDVDGQLGHAVLVGQIGHQALISDFGVKYWLEGVPPAPKE